jgi:hypothetical protein
VCNSSATTPFIANVATSSFSSCTIVVTVHTNLTCSLQVTSPALLCPSGCCGLGYDWSALSYDIFGYDTGFGVWGFHMCGSVSSCNANTQACQSAAVSAASCSGASAVRVGAFNPSEQVWSFINGVDWTGGVQLYTANGAVCNSNGPRVTVVQLLCDPSALRPNTLFVVEKPQCVYTITIRTAVVCMSPTIQSSSLVVATPQPYVAPVFGCQFQGYDLSPLSAYDVIVDYNGYLFVNRVCGQVSDRACARYMAVANSSVCQVSSACGSVGGAYLVSSWNPYIAQSQLISGGGLQVQVQDGTNCGNGPRAVKWIFLCDPSAKWGYGLSVVEEFGNDYCHYDVTIMTNIVCQTINHTSTGMVSSSSTGQPRLFNSSTSGVERMRGVQWGLLTVCVAVALSCFLG